MNYVIKILSDVHRLFIDKWVSVNHELPKLGETVLCYSNKAIYTATYDSGGWYDSDTWICEGEDQPTHWRNLPKPPTIYGK